MPFLRYSRDRRGYEHVYLVQPVGKRGKTRILYWYRTPPGVKVGREPFDADVRRSIEAQYPDVEFDWPKLLATPKPPPQADVERWRERRRQVKAEKAALLASGAEEAQEVEEEEEQGVEAVETEEPGDFPDIAEIETTAAEVVADTVAEPGDVGVSIDEPMANESEPVRGDAAPAERMRRRRRRRHRKPGRGGAGPEMAAAASDTAAENDAGEGEDASLDGRKPAERPDPQTEE